MASQWEDKSKEHLNIVFIGHVDHGKSTTVGRLLLDSGHIEDHVIEKNEKSKTQTKKNDHHLWVLLLLLLNIFVEIPFRIKDGFSVA